MINNFIRLGNPGCANWLRSIKTRLPEMNRTLNKQVGYGKLILQTLSAKLNLNHFKDIIYIDEPLEHVCSAKLFEQFTSLNQFETIEKNGLEALSYGE